MYIYSFLHVFQTRIERNFNELENMILLGIPMDFVVRFKQMNWPPSIPVGARYLSNRHYTPLMFAVAYNRSDLVQKLVDTFSARPQAAAEAVDVQCTWGISALMIAAITDNEVCVPTAVPFP